MLQALVDMANVGVMVLDSGNRIEYANRMCSHITGYEHDSLVGKLFADLLDDKNRELFETLKKNTTTCSTNLYQGIEMRTAYDSAVTAEMACSTFSAHAEEKCFVYFRDISNREGLTQELQKSEQRYRELFDRVDQGIYVSSKEGHFIDCNKALLHILGYDSEDEVLNLDLARDLYVNPEDRTKYQKNIERDGYVRNYEVEFKKKSGESIPIHLNSHVIKDEKGEVIGYQGLIIDVSENIRMRREVDKQNRFMSNLLESSVDCIVAADIKGTVIFFNHAAEKLTGYDSEEVIGKFHITKFYPLETAKEIMRMLRSDDHGGPGKLQDFHVNMLGKDGEEIPLSMSASIVREGDEELASLGIFTDLREKMKMEKELQEAQLRLVQTEKMASLGSLVCRRGP